MTTLKLNDHVVNVMNKTFFESLQSRYASTPVDLLPPPVSGVPLTAQDYDYKTYFVFRARP